MSNNPSPTSDDIRKYVILPPGYDLALCSPRSCPKQFVCYRFLAEPVGRQDFLGSSQMVGKPVCDMFWDVREILKRGLNRHLIAKAADILAHQHITEPELHWRLAEAELKVEALIQVTWDSSKPQNPIQIPPVGDAEIRPRAFLIWKTSTLSVAELYWLVAEQELLWDVLCWRGVEQMKKYFPS